MIVKHEIAYNSQRNNFNFAGKFSGYAQCFSTCSWMFMSFYTLTIDATNDKMLAKYVDDVEITVGTTPGLAEKIVKENKEIVGRSSLYWKVQQIGINMWLNNEKVEGSAICDLNMSFYNLKKTVEKQPIIIGTKKMGGLAGGHIILGVGCNDDSIICHDPYGDAQKQYKEYDGKYVYYEDKFLKKYFVNRTIWWKN